MIDRKVVTSKALLKNGSTVDITILDGVVPEDLLIQGMKAEGYRVITKKEVFPEIGRDLRDYLVRLRVLT